MTHIRQIGIMGSVAIRPDAGPIVWIAPVICALTSMLLSAQFATAGSAVRVEQGGGPGAASQDLHLTAEEMLAAEQQFSPLLQEHRRRYRLSRMVRDVEQLRTRMLVLAQDIEAILDDVAQEELDNWLQLGQDAYAAADQIEHAAYMLERRYAHLALRMSAALRAEQALMEANIATAKRDYEIATLLFDRARQLAQSDALLFRAVLERGRMVSEQHGMEAAVGYYLGVVAEFEKSLPELAHEAHFRAAEEYQRHRQFDDAFDVLASFEDLYPDTEIADRARHTIRGWEVLPGEQIEETDVPK